MTFHGDLADAELTGDLFVQPSGYDQRDHLAFATAERRVTFSKRANLRFVTQGTATSLERLRNCVQQHIIAERLRQELRCAALLREPVTVI